MQLIRSGIVWCPNNSGQVERSYFLSEMHRESTVSNVLRENSIMQIGFVNDGRFAGWKSWMSTLRFYERFGVFLFEQTGPECWNQIEIEA